MMKILSFSEWKMICLLDQCVKTKKRAKRCILKIAYCPVINLCIVCFRTVTYVTPSVNKMINTHQNMCQ